MDKLVILLVIVAVTILVAKLRNDAARSRKEVMARLATERDERGGIDYSPTAELFREVGVRHDAETPLPRDLPAGFPPLPSSASDLPESAPQGAVTVGFNDLPDLTEPAAAPPAPPVSESTASPAEPGDLRAMFQGISMPAGLRPLGSLDPAAANFVTDAAPATVHAGLEAEFERLDCVARWIEPTVAQTERNGMQSLVTIYPNPLAAMDLEGQPLFPGIGPGHVVVRMLAL